MRREPALGGAPKPAPLLWSDHLQRMSELSAPLALDLAEDESVASTDDQVELVPTGPDVPAEDAVAAQPVVERRPALEAAADPARAQAAEAGS